MKWYLLLVFISISCLPRDKNLNNDDTSPRETGNSKSDDSQDQPARETGNSEPAKTKGTDNIFYHKYRFSNGGSEVAIRINRKEDGNFRELQVINLSKNTAIDSIPLSFVPQAIAGRAPVKEIFLFSGDSYSQQGFYRLSYDSDLTKTSIADLNNKPPEIMFTNFKRNNSGQNVVQRGSAVAKLTASQWQQLAGQRAQVPSYANPSPLPSYLQHWFDNDFNVGTKKLDKLEHHRALTIAGNTYYGAVYQSYDGSKGCWGQFWGFDNIEVVKFLYELRGRVSLTLNNNSGAFSTLIDCSSTSDNDLELTCIDGVIKDQGVFQIINGKLAIRETNNTINGYIDTDGTCHQGAP